MFLIAGILRSTIEGKLCSGEGTWWTDCRPTSFKSWRSRQSKFLKVQVISANSFCRRMNYMRWGNYITHGDGGHDFLLYESEFQE